MYVVGELAVSRLLTVVNLKGIEKLVQEVMGMGHKHMDWSKEN